MKKFTLVIAIVFFATAAAADDAVPVFPLPTGTFNAPLPAGYCLATGPFEALAKIMASADNVNMTDVTYVACGDFTAGKLSSWGMIKTPLETLREKVGPRAPALAQLKATVNSDEGKAFSTISNGDLEKYGNLNKIFGPDFKGSAKFDALDSDDNAVYFGGVANYDDGKGHTSKVAAAYAITVVKDSVFEIYVYKPFSDVGDIAALLAIVKPEAAAFVAANGG